MNCVIFALVINGKSISYHRNENVLCVATTRRVTSEYIKTADRLTKILNSTSGGKRFLEISLN
jgi:hypothetical protein